MNRLLLLVCLVGCGGGMRDMMMTPAGAGGGSSSSGAGGGGAGGGSSSSGPSCSIADDCAYWFCECTGTSTPVNSRTCNNGQCASAQTACTNGCSAFGRSWSGRTFGSSSSGSGGGGGSSSNNGGQPGSTCSSRLDCAALTCGCTDGALLTVRDCLNNFCNDRASACEDACVDSNHGHWDGQ